MLSVFEVCSVDVELKRTVTCTIDSKNIANLLNLSRLQITGSFFKKINQLKCGFSVSLAGPKVWPFLLSAKNIFFVDFFWLLPLLQLENASLSKNDVSLERRKAKSMEGQQTVSSIQVRMYVGMLDR